MVIRDEAEELICASCGANMSENEDGELECDGPNCIAHFDSMNFDADEV